MNTKKGIVAIVSYFLEQNQFKFCWMFTRLSHKINTVQMLALQISLRSEGPNSKPTAQDPTLETFYDK